MLALADYGPNNHMLVWADYGPNNHILALDDYIPNHHMLALADYIPNHHMLVLDDYIPTSPLTCAQVSLVACFSAINVLKMAHNPGVVVNPGIAPF